MHISQSITKEKSCTCSCCYSCHWNDFCRKKSLDLELDRVWNVENVFGCFSSIRGSRTSFFRMSRVIVTPIDDSFPVSHLWTSRSFAMLTQTDKVRPTRRRKLGFLHHHLFLFRQRSPSNESLCLHILGGKSKTPLTRVWLAVDSFFCVCFADNPIGSNSSASRRVRLHLCKQERISIGMQIIDDLFNL